MFDKNTQLHKKGEKIKKEIVTAQLQPRSGKTLQQEKVKLEEPKRQPVCPDCDGKFVYYRSTEDNFRCRRCGKVFEWGKK